MYCDLLNTAFMQTALLLVALIILNHIGALNPRAKPSSIVNKTRAGKGLSADTALAGFVLYLL